MGIENVRLLEQARKEGGLTLSMRVAIALGTGGDEAENVPDNPERILKAKEIISEALKVR